MMASRLLRSALKKSKAPAANESLKKSLMKWEQVFQDGIGNAINALVAMSSIKKSAFDSLHKDAVHLRDTVYARLQDMQDSREYDELSEAIQGCVIARKASSMLATKFFDRHYQFLEHCKESRLKVVHDTNSPDLIIGMTVEGKEACYWDMRANEGWTAKRDSMLTAPDTVIYEPLSEAQTKVVMKEGSLDVSLLSPEEREALEDSLRAENISWTTEGNVFKFADSYQHTRAKTLYLQTIATKEAAKKIRKEEFNASSVQYSFPMWRSMVKKLHKGAQIDGTPDSATAKVNDKVVGSWTGEEGTIAATEASADAMDFDTYNWFSSQADKQKTTTDVMGIPPKRLSDQQKKQLLGDEDLLKRYCFKYDLNMYRIQSNGKFESLAFAPKRKIVTEGTEDEMMQLAISLGNKLADETDCVAVPTDTGVWVGHSDDQDGDLMSDTGTIFAVIQASNSSEYAVLEIPENDDGYSWKLYLSQGVVFSRETVDA
jgi:hypothetical protein